MAGLSSTSADRLRSMYIENASIFRFPDQSSTIVRSHKFTLEQSLEDVVDYEDEISELTYDLLGSLWNDPAF